MLTSIAFIPDGNRRFARKNLLSLATAYTTGFEKGKDIFRWILDYPEVKEVTLWAISTENLKRSSIELTVFLKLLKNYLKGLVNDKEIHENGVRIKIIGKLELLPKGVQQACEEVMQATRHNTQRVLNLAIGYGGHTEIVDAVAAIVKQGDPVTEETIENSLYTKNSPDLIVRTGGTQRLSGFMPWQSAYSELYFSEKLWPEFSKQDLKNAVQDFDSRKRRFGK